MRYYVIFDTGPRLVTPRSMMFRLKINGFWSNTILINNIRMQFYYYLSTHILASLWIFIRYIYFIPEAKRLLTYLLHIISYKWKILSRRLQTTFTTIKTSSFFNNCLELKMADWNLRANIDRWQVTVKNVNEPKLKTCYSLIVLPA